MVPMHTAPACDSRRSSSRRPTPTGTAASSRDGIPIAQHQLPEARRASTRCRPRTASPTRTSRRCTARDVLATTVLQTCIRYESRTQDLPVLRDRPVAGGRPHDRAQDARAARRGGARRGAARRRQAHGDDDRHAARRPIAAPRCSPRAPSRSRPRSTCRSRGSASRRTTTRWFERMHEAGIDTLGMHLEAVTPEVRERIMPGKAQVPVERYIQAFEAAVGGVRARAGQHLHPGRASATRARRSSSTCERLVALGVYPFVVPFVPICGTPLEEPSGADARVHARDPVEPLGAMLGAAACARATSRPAAASAARARRSRVYEA